MKYILPLFFMVLSLAMIVYCGKKEEQQASADISKPAVDKIEKATLKDLACGMELTADEVKATYTYKGKEYSFCSEVCKDKFVNDPEKFLAEVGETQEHTSKEEVGHSHEKASSHGGDVTMTKEFHFETTFHNEGIHLYLYDRGQKPISAKGVTGKVLFRLRDGSESEVQLEYISKKDGVSPDYLEGKSRLLSAKEGEFKAVFHLEGLPRQEEKIQDFVVTVTRGKDKHEEHREH